ncbi:hypothetical protein CSA56_05885 [candidate division KSB3 bacterium]|uniref:DUF2997 domain-containing protein n=1 Tax=candidate division KSB3 bacterium TaxID=2044937 RepID=A0A2G6KH62_9BACT|nr:MAG: hypothetical protein CSA56_05885 [candidate division KSB3 bacterium]
MLNKQEVEFTITPDGNVEFSIKGVKGKQCLPVAELFNVLGTVESDQPTAEFYAKGDGQDVTIRRT